jgi:hypothetical protein
MGVAKDSQAETDDLSGGSQKNCIGAESTVGEGTNPKKRLEN